MEREIFIVLMFKYIYGALQGVVFTCVCRNFFWCLALADGFVTGNTVPSLCSHHGAEFVVLI